MIKKAFFAIGTILFMIFNYYIELNNLRQKLSGENNFGDFNIDEILKFLPDQMSKEFGPDNPINIEEFLKMCKKE